MAIDFMNLFAPRGTPSALDALLSEDQRKLMGRNANLSAAAALLAASGPSRQRVGLGQALGAALQAGQQGYQQARAGSLQELMLGEKLKEAQDERQRNTDYFEMLRQAGQPAPAANATPVPTAAIDGPGVQVFAPDAPQAAPSAASPFSGLTQQQIAIMRGLPRTEGLKYAMDALKPEPTPESIRTLRALRLPETVEGLRQLDKPTPPPSAIAEYQYAVNQGYKGTFEQFNQAQRQATASRTQVDVKMPGNQQFLAGVGTDISSTLSNLTAGATAANSTLRNVERILPALDKAVLGPGADYRTTLLRVGQQLGIAGQNANDTLAQTATVVQGLAQAELDAAAQMKGQGTLTDAERAILRRAAGGDQSLTAVEIQTGLNAAKKNAQARLQLQQDYLRRARKLPGFEQFAPLYEVTPYGGNNPLINLIDQSLQQRQGGR